MSTWALRQRTWTLRIKSLPCNCAVSWHGSKLGVIPDLMWCTHSSGWARGWTFLFHSFLWFAMCVALAIWSLAASSIPLLNLQRAPSVPFSDGHLYRGRWAVPVIPCVLGHSDHWGAHSSYELLSWKTPNDCRGVDINRICNSPLLQSSLRQS